MNFTGSFSYCRVLTEAQRTTSVTSRLDWRNWKGILNTTFVPHLGTTKQEEIAGSRVQQETRSWKTVPKSAAERKWDAFSKQTSPSFPIFFTLSFSKWKYTCHLGLRPIWLMMPMCCVFTYSPECWGYWTFFFFFAPENFKTALLR